jgi:methionyl-tRNA synthetase
VSGRVFYLTTPIYYINAPPHLGHAYTTILADAMARWHRLAGDDVFLLTGTDEHGDKIAQAAAKAGVTPQALADRNSAAFRRAWDQLGIRYDDFIRTTEPRHQTVVQQILQALRDKDEIYLGTYGGHYCFGCERFYTEKEIVDGKCPDHRTPLQWIEEENYFFRMSAYQRWLIEHIERHPDFIRPERYRNEILGFLREPLQDLSISRPCRRLQWGIPLPFDPDYVTYVWFDALINYVSALGGPGAPRFEQYWPHAQHLIGKDILKPHAVYWPCMLAALAKAHDKAPEAFLYRHLNVHGYWGLGGGKMSKSIGNVVEALALKDKYGNDAFRYFVMREMVFGLDADFSEEAFVTRFNADLANDLGNLASRATTLIVNNGGITRVPSRDEFGEPGPALPGLIERVVSGTAGLGNAMDEFAFQAALARIWSIVATLNEYIAVTKPWELAKQADTRRELERVLYALGESLRILGIVLEPFLPDAAAKIRAGVGQSGEPRLADAVWGRLTPGTRIEKVSQLFPRVEAAKAGATPPGAPSPAVPVAADGAPRISIDEFQRVDLRVALVLAAEAVPKSKKLLKLRVSLGAEERTVLAGIAEHYKPEDLVGKKVVVVANLQPAKLMGIESQGMILAGEGGQGLGVVTPDRDLPPGSRVK